MCVENEFFCTIRASLFVFRLNQLVLSGFQPIFFFSLEFVIVIHCKCFGCKNCNYKFCYISRCTLDAIFAPKHCSSFWLSILHPIAAATFGCSFCINQLQIFLFTYFATYSCSRFWLLYLHLLAAQGPAAIASTPFEIWKRLQRFYSGVRLRIN